MLRSEQGSVTAELAVAMPAVLVVVSLGFGLLGLQAERIKLVSVAAAEARALARGEKVDAKHWTKGNMVCVEVESKMQGLLKESTCARALGI